jgi:hypothetical protein
MDEGHAVLGRTPEKSRPRDGIDRSIGVGDSFVARHLADEALGAALAEDRADLQQHPEIGVERIDPLGQSGIHRRRQLRLRYRRREDPSPALEVRVTAIDKHLGQLFQEQRVASGRPKQLVGTARYALGEDLIEQIARTLLPQWFEGDDR